jgi:hypothetical protein
MASSAAGSSPVPASLAPFHDFGGSKGRVTTRAPNPALALFY